MKMNNIIGAVVEASNDELKRDILALWLSRLSTSSGSARIAVRQFRNELRCTTAYDAVNHKLESGGFLEPVRAVRVDESRYFPRLVGGIEDSLAIIVRDRACAIANEISALRGGDMRVCEGAIKGKMVGGENHGAIAKIFFGICYEEEVLLEHFMRAASVRLPPLEMKRIEDILKPRK